MATSVVRGIQRLFVGNLPWTVGTRELQLYFSKFGPIQQAIVIFDRKTGISKGYGFITYGTRDGYNSAANKQVHHLEGRVLTVQPTTK